MTKYAITIEAMQFTGSNFYEVANFLGHGDLTGNNILHPTDSPVVSTPKGDVVAPVGSWITRLEGSNYVLPSDSFVPQNSK